MENYRRRLTNNDATLTEINLIREGIINDEVKILSEGLRHNDTVTMIILRNNKIGDEGARMLARALHQNHTLARLNLCENMIGVEGAKAFERCLRVNRTLRYLNLRNNNIGDEGAISLANCLRQNNSIKNYALVNETLTELYLSYNKIGTRGAAALEDAVCHNATLIRLEMDYGTNMKMRKRLHELTSWNRLGSICPTNISELPLTCKDYFLLILMIMNDLPICDDMHWIIISMLKVWDIVNNGDL